LLQKALLEMSKDEQAIKAIQKKVGKYEWVIGAEGNARRDTLMTFVTEDALRDLVKFSNEALNIEAVYKESILNPDAVDVVEEAEQSKSIRGWLKDFFNWQ
jgi:hypothetical protein